MIAVEPEMITLFDEDVLDVPFDTGRVRLQGGCEGELGEPVEAYMRLFAVKDGVAVARIGGYRDLGEHVRSIENPEEAAAFLRLPTSPGTWFLFPSDIIELDCDSMAAYRADGWTGESWTLETRDDGYLVQRCLYVWRETLQSAERHLVTELVGHNANYERLADRIIDADTGLAMPFRYE